MSKKAETPNYWLFQAAPKVFDLRNALRRGALETFAAKQHRKKIRAGDKVILWQSGKEAGCYALATVLSEASKMPIAEAEKPFYHAEVEADWRVALTIDYNLWNKPLTTELLPDAPAFTSFNAGLPGTNFQATAQQYDLLIKKIREMELALEPEPEYRLPDPSPPLNLILYGPPGTGKTFLTVNHALSIIENRNLSELALEDRSALRKRYEKYFDEGRIAFVTFHQSFSYEDFVEGIKPVTREGRLEYAIEDGIFKRICLEARADFRKHEKKPIKCLRYVLIIDEINRGNIANIFGELISLLETDKREGRPEALASTLPYSKESFSIPPNLFLIGTMNSTDRSIAQMDMALRRRFAFKELAPAPERIAERQQPMAAGIDLMQLLRTMNRRLALLLGADYQIGHAYFLDIYTLDDIKNRFARQILPLLREYFYDDLGKLGLVLGRDFVEEVPIDTEDVFADFPQSEMDTFSRRPLYRLRPVAQLDESAFIHIYDETYQHGR